MCQSTTQLAGFRRDHFFFRVVLLGGPESAALAAASNTSLTASPVKLEHSTNATAPIRRANFSPIFVLTGWTLIELFESGSSRKSLRNPHRMIGTPGARSSTVGSDYVLVPRESFTIKGHGDDVPHPQ